MSDSTLTLEQVIDGLRAEGLLPADAAGPADALIASLRAVQPWYIRTMVAFGAWLASLLLIGFVAGFGLAMGDSIIVGLALIAGAAWFRRRDHAGEYDFVVQCTLATSLAGQALFAWGVADLLPGDALKTGCLVVMAVAVLLFFVFPDRIHRVLMILFAAGAAVTLIYAFRMNAAIPFAGPLLTAAAVFVFRRRGTLTAAGRGELVRPLVNGLVLSAFGCLLLSTVYVLPELGTDFSFYPRPWISTLLLGALLLYVALESWRSLLKAGSARAAAVVWLLWLLVVAAAWAAPGLLLALIVVTLGASAGHRTFVAAGIAFLAIFVTAYFYGIEVTMLQKSFALAGSGLAILVARWTLLRLLGGNAGG